MLKIWGSVRLIAATRPRLQRFMSSAAGTEAGTLTTNKRELDNPQLKSMKTRLRDLSTEFQKSQLISKQFRVSADHKSSTAKSVDSILERSVAQLELIERKFPGSSLQSEQVLIAEHLLQLDDEAFSRVKNETLGYFLLSVIAIPADAHKLSELLPSVANRILPRLLAKKTEPGNLKILSQVFKSEDAFGKMRLTGETALGLITTVMEENSKLKIDLEPLLVRILESGAELSSHPDQFKNLLDRLLLKYCWSPRLAQKLFHRGFMSFRLFKYWIIEEFKFTPQTKIADLTEDQAKALGFKKSSPHGLEFADYLEMNGLYFLTFLDLPTEFVGEIEKTFTKRGQKNFWSNKGYSEGQLLNTKHLTEPEYEKARKNFSATKHGAYAPHLVSEKLAREEDLSHIRTNILMLMYNNPKGEFIKTMRLQDLLGLVYATVELLQVKEAKQYWTQHMELLKKRMELIHEDFGAMLEGSSTLFTSPYLIRNIYPEYLRSLIKFLESQLAPQHYTDTKYRAWQRGFPEIAYLADTLLPLAEKIGTEIDTSEFIGHQMHVSKLISDALVDPIMHPEFENDLDSFLVLSADDEKIADPSKREVTNSRMSESTKIRQGKITPSGKQADLDFKTRPTDLHEVESHWKEFEKIVRVNHSFLDKWDNNTLAVFISMVNRMIKSGMATKKLVLAGIRVFEYFLPKLDPKQFLSLIKLLTDINFLTGTIRESLEETLKKKLKIEIIPYLQANLPRIEYLEALIQISYFCTLNKLYNQEMWNSLVFALDTTMLESQLSLMSSNSLIQLGHVVLLTRMEASYIRTATLDSLMPYLTNLSKAEFNLFKPSQFSSDVGSLLQKYYYDYLKKGELAELFRVHYLQEKHVILCLDHEHFLINSGIVKGQVATSIRLLKGLGFEIHIISRRRYNYSEKRSVRLDYLRENLVGVRINEKRKIEVETTAAHDY